ncbi:MAG TPA: hypothetical protein PKE26_11910 [Kiritimatiellia bacterium]|nr:hypothetical protein [Kiritimatiellia bacterium]HMO99806.1 hypothetical protein [Kiritimatiellia bacterium]HMP97215.1 hypothetical protein [Kiritimatiellia bacterium]
MIRAFLVLILSAAPAAAWMAKTAPFAEDRATYGQWSNLIHAINERCEPTWYGTNGVAPMETATGVYIVAPTNYVAIWPVGSYLMISNRVTLTNSQGDVYVVTNHRLESIKVPFTNMVGSLTGEMIDLWLASNTWLEAVDTPSAVVVTNVAMTLENAFVLDSKIRALLPYYVDMSQIDAAGGIDAYFASPSTVYNWNDTTWVPTNSYPTTLPYLNESNAWKNAGLSNYYYEVVTTSAVATTETVPGWVAYERTGIAGHLDQFIVSFTNPPGLRTNSFREYLFSLAPAVTNYRVQLASIRLSVTNTTIATNTWTQGNVTNIYTETTRDLAWVMEPYTRLEYDRLVRERLEISRTGAVTVAIMTRPATNDAINLPISLSASGPVFSVESPHPRTVDVFSVNYPGAVTSSVPFAEVTSLWAPSNWTRREITRDGVYPPGWTNQPSAEGTVISIVQEYDKQQFKRHVFPDVGLGYGQPSEVMEMAPFGDAIYWRERWSIITQLQVTAVAFGLGHFRANSAGPVPYTVQRSPPVDGAFRVQYVGQTYDFYGCDTNASTFGMQSSFSSSGSCNEPYSTSTNTMAQFFGFSHDYCLRTDYPWTNLSNSVMVDHISWGYQQFFRMGMEQSFSHQSTVNQVLLFPPFGLCTETTESDYYQASSAVGGSPLAWPQTIAVEIGGLATGVQARARIYALTSLIVPTNAGGDKMLVDLEYLTADCVSTSIQVTLSLQPNPLESTINGRYHRVASSPKSQHHWIDFGRIDLNNGISPDNGWFKTMTVSGGGCQSSGVSTSGFAGTIITSWSSSESKTHHLFYSAYRTAYRSLEGLTLVLDWLFDDADP